MCFSFNSGAAGALTAMIIKRLGFAEKYWSLLFTINGGLTGMVRPTEPWVILKDLCWVVSQEGQG